ncbi:MAG: metal ABC transporter substrate-binding protein [Fibromonadales bacterium]|nr:metal ABC transporter substrate-binding protein [Fibromonadales bacterium]
MKRILVFMLIFCVALTLSCEKKKKDTQQTSQNKINVVATIFPLYDFARATAKEHANITMLILPGASIHAFEPSPADIKNIQNADVFLYIGGENDAWAKRILSTLDTSKIKIVRLFDYIKLYEEEEIDHDHKHSHDHEHKEKGEIKIEYDEHIWTSSKNATIMLEAITKAFCEIDSLNCENYEKNSEGYISQLAELSNELSQITNSAKRKKIVVADRFPFLYLTKEYGLDYVAAFPGCSDQADASAATIAFLIRTIKKDKIPYVYHVELSNKNTAKTVAEQTDSKMLLLHSYHNVSKQDFENGVTYLDLFKQNVANLKVGLSEE